MGAPAASTGGGGEAERGGDAPAPAAALTGVRRMLVPCTPCRGRIGAPDYPLSAN
jgi:hypothetical protein